MNVHVNICTSVEALNCPRASINDKAYPPYKDRNEIRFLFELQNIITLRKNIDLECVIGDSVTGLNCDILPGNILNK